MPETNQSQTNQPPGQQPPPYDRDAIFHDDGPINPIFISEAIRTIMRALPLDSTEPQAWSHRRMFGAMQGLAALNPRDEIEVMLGVQAQAAYHAAAACWRIGMNVRKPNGDSTRHITAAATAARTFDTMLRAIERRQAKPLSVPIGRPPARTWPPQNPTGYMNTLEDRCRTVGAPAEPEPDVVWTPEDIAVAEALMQRERIEKENEGLDLANTEGILPGGGMILMENPTPEQAKYMGRRLALMYKREFEDHLKATGIRKIPKIRGIRPGDLIP
jgi:hypothetical protein